MPSVGLLLGSLILEAIRLGSRDLIFEAALRRPLEIKKNPFVRAYVPCSLSPSASLYLSIYLYIHVSFLEATLLLSLQCRRHEHPAETVGALAEESSAAPVQLESASVDGRSWPAGGRRRRFVSKAWQRVEKDSTQSSYNVQNFLKVCLNVPSRLLEPSFGLQVQDFGFQVWALAWLWLGVAQRFPGCPGPE